MLVRERRHGELQLQLHKIDEIDDSPLALVNRAGAGPRMLRFLKSLDVFDQSEYVVLALDEDKTLVGAFGILGSTYYAGRWDTRGTYVLPSRRRSGVARAMWMFMVRTLKIKHVDCVVISRSGRSFARSWEHRKIKGTKIDVADDVRG